MIKRSLRKLRQQPKSTRDTIALVIAGSLSGVVALVWLYHAPVKLGEGTSGIISGANENGQPGFMDMFSDFGSQMATVKESYLEVQETLVGEEFKATSSLEEFILEEEVSQDKGVVEEEESSATTSSATITQPRTIRIITTNEESSEVHTSESQ